MDRFVYGAQRQPTAADDASTQPFELSDTGPDSDWEDPFIGSRVRSGSQPA